MADPCRSVSRRGSGRIVRRRSAATAPVFKRRPATQLIAKRGGAFQLDLVSWLLCLRFSRWLKDRSALCSKSISAGLSWAAMKLSASDRAARMGSVVEDIAEPDRVSRVRVISSLLCRGVTVRRLRDAPPHSWHATTRTPTRRRPLPTPPRQQSDPRRADGRLCRAALRRGPVHTADRAADGCQQVDGAPSGAGVAVHASDCGRASLSRTTAPIREVGQQVVSALGR